MAADLLSPEASERAKSLTARARKALADPRSVANLRWLHGLSGAPVGEILQVLEEVDSLLPVEEEIRRRQVAGGRGDYAQFRAPFEIYALTRLLRPEHIVETGVSSGVSSAHFLLALDKNRSGTLHSIDFPTRQRGPILGPDESPVSLPPGLSSGWAIPFRSPRWDLRIGPSQELLPQLLAELPKVDLFLHDDLHTEENLASQLEQLRAKAPVGAVLLADNTEWTGEAFPRFAKAIGARVQRRGNSDLVGLRVPPPRRRATRSASPS